MRDDLSAVAQTSLLCNQTLGGNEHTAVFMSTSNQIRFPIANHFKGDGWRELSPTGRSAQSLTSNCYYLEAMSCLYERIIK